jgi:hypothetical protein
MILADSAFDFATVAKDFGLSTVILVAVGWFFFVPLSQRILILFDKHIKLADRADEAMGKFEDAADKLKELTGAIAEGHTRTAAQLSEIKTLILNQADKD